MTTYASLVPHGLQFHADIIKVRGNQTVGNVKLSNENQDLEVSISGNCAYTAYGETHFQKLGSFLPQLLMPIGCCWSSVQDYYQSFNWLQRPYHMADMVPSLGRDIGAFFMFNSCVNKKTLFIILYDPLYGQYRYSSYRTLNFKF